MHRITVAFKIFFAILSDKGVAERAERLLEKAQAEPVESSRPERPAPPVAAPVSTRSDALTLLSVLQREARLIDFLKEEIGGYDDAQIGAAVRDVHRDAGATLERLFALRPLMDQGEGAEIVLTGAPDTNRVRLVGNVGAQSPGRGRLQHAGWQATKVEVPQYTGQAGAALVIAPAEVEV